ncbi:DUF5985 family protein [Sphingomonas sp. LM7]|uniref:DUF5985 family protein n=1 Tax=Sphingomonas sp. LM7 TaxID=1938607 RepID=UPI000983B498|nr:DUF5985 family protein [Sphingomonas sp. LM7]AQR73478.1 hypothetical protein BXU08_07350 [Sphingomonas sp. LM7]
MTAWFAPVVYLLCFATSAACTLLLARSYRRSGMRLLLWSASCFGLLAANNLFVIVDLLLIRSIDFGLVRQFLSLAAVAVLLLGFIWDMEQDA